MAVYQGDHYTFNTEGNIIALTVNGVSFSYQVAMLVPQGRDKAPSCQPLEVADQIDLETNLRHRKITAARLIDYIQNKVPLEKPLTQYPLVFNLLKPHAHG